MSQDTYEGVPIQRIDPGESGMETPFNPRMDRAERRLRMIELQKQGMSAADIAKKWGLSSYTVWRILRRPNRKYKLT
jgi:DNA invertase Pin-like site-specific DNA recombinase